MFSVFNTQTSLAACPVHDISHENTPWCDLRKKAISPTTCWQRMEKYETATLCWQRMEKYETSNTAFTQDAF